MKEIADIIKAFDEAGQAGKRTALATVVHCMTRWLAARHDAGHALPAHTSLAISENRWRAATDGVDNDVELGTVK